MEEEEPNFESNPRG